MIAVIGATGYIGRSLARKIAGTEQGPLALFARDPSRLAAKSWPDHVSLHSLDAFDAGDFSLVINAIGAGDPRNVAALGRGIVETSQAWDERVLAGMGAGMAYVFLSSGAVYGSGLADTVDANSLPAERFESIAPYTLAKLFAENRHRDLPERPILDIRVYGYADASIDRSGSFFLAELAQAVATRQPFMTSPGEMIRDYAGVEELYDLIQAWKGAGRPNRALDLYTLAPVGKLALLETVSKRYGLKIVHKGDAADGPRPVYASQFYAASDLGYRPARTSLQVVLETLDAVAAG